jgi:hypothetical protein
MYVSEWNKCGIVTTYVSEWNKCGIVTTYVSEWNKCGIVTTYVSEWNKCGIVTTYVSASVWGTTDLPLHCNITLCSDFDEMYEVSGELTVTLITIWWLQKLGKDWL